jgi:glyceraldehyde 3-phosphate dehydrogenase
MSPQSPPPLRFGINGLGRVGRALARIAAGRPALELAAVNDLAGARELAPRLARDSVHGRYAGSVEAVAGGIAIDGRTVPAWSHAEPAGIPWPDAGVEVVVEATGRFLRRSAAAAHLRGPVRQVVISANASRVDPADLTVCLGVNGEALDPRRHAVVSNASCTTNCLALVAKVLHDAFGLRRGLMSTVHGYTGNQRLLDQPHEDPRRARAAALHMVPIATTSPAALGLVIPALAGRVEGLAVRVPTPAAALLDLVAELERPVAVDEVVAAFRAAAGGPLSAYLGINEEPLVSGDFVGDPRSAVVDLPLLQESNGLLRVIAWYDNEWGYASRLADLLELLAGHPSRPTSDLEPPPDPGGLGRPDSDR